MIIGTQQNQTLSRDLPEHSLEGDFNVSKIMIDIAMIKLQRSDNGCIRQIMQKLGSFIKESSVVLVSLDNEGGAFLA